MDEGLPPIQKKTISSSHLPNSHTNEDLLTKKNKKVYFFLPSLVQSGKGTTMQTSIMRRRVTRSVTSKRAMEVKEPQVTE
jgi:hypothetical protein